MTKLKGKEKALIFLSMIGESSSAAILNSLPADVAQRITSELNSFKKPDPAAVGLVLKEISQFSVETEERMQLPGEVEADAQVEDLDGFSLLARKKAEDLITMLQSEKKETITTVLSFLPEVRKEEFLKELSHGKRTEYRDMLASFEKVPFTDTLFDKINQVLVS